MTAEKLNEIIYNLTIGTVSCMQNIVCSMNGEEIDGILTLKVTKQDKNIIDSYATIFSLYHPVRKDEIVEIYYLGTTVFKIILDESL